MIYIAMAFNDHSNCIRISSNFIYLSVIKHRTGLSSSLMLSLIVFNSAIFEFGLRLSTDAFRKVMKESSKVLIIILVPVNPVCLINSGCEYLHDSPVSLL